jgi:predicted dehydrogenase
MKDMMKKTDSGQKPLGLGVLGLGEGRSIISAALASEIWQLVNICDLREDRCRERAAEFGLTRYTTELDEMLADPAIDAIAIYTPDPLHAEHALRCFEAGKHVICTKPFLTDLKDAGKLLASALRTERKLLVGQSSRFFEPMLHQRADCEAGKHGQIVSVEAHYHHDHRNYMRFTWAAGGAINWLFGGLSHPVDLVRFYLPDIEEVFGYGFISPNGKELGLKTADTMHFVMKTSDGRVARVSGVYGCPGQVEKRDSLVTCVIRGTQGCSQADYLDLRYATNFEGEGEVIHTFENRHDYYFRFESTYHHAGEFQNYLDYFGRCLRSGETAKPDLHEGVVTVGVMIAMQESLATGQSVRVADILNRHGLTPEGRLK